MRFYVNSGDQNDAGQNLFVFTEFMSVVMKSTKRTVPNVKSLLPYVREYTYSQYVRSGYVNYRFPGDLMPFMYVDRPTVCCRYDVDHRVVL